MRSIEWVRQRDPLKGSPPPPFIDTRRDGVHAQGIVEVVVFSPNRRGAVVKHCGKYTVGHGVRRGSHPGYRPWSCGDRAGVLPAPASSSGGILRAPQVKVLRAPAVAGHAAVPDPLVGVLACTLGGPGGTWRSRTPRGGIRDSGCERWASLFEGPVATPDPLPSRRWARGHTYDEVESVRPELAE